MVMKKEELLNYNVKIISNGQETLSNILKQYTSTEQLQYCWAHLDKKQEIYKVKIKADDEYYKSLKSVVDDIEVQMAISRTCMEDAEEDLLLVANSKVILEMLIENYWDLDEVCIFSEKKNWFLVINHVFEIFFVGEELVSCFKILNDERKMFIISNGNR